MASKCLQDTLFSVNDGVVTPLRSPYTNRDLQVIKKCFICFCSRLKVISRFTYLFCDWWSELHIFSARVWLCGSPRGSNKESTSRGSTIVSPVSWIHVRWNVLTCLILQFKFHTVLPLDWSTKLGMTALSMVNLGLSLKLSLTEWWHLLNKCFSKSRLHFSLITFFLDLTQHLCQFS